MNPLLLELDRLGAELARGAEDASITTHRLASATVFRSRRSIFVGTFAPERSLVIVLLEGRKDVESAGRPRQVVSPGDVFVAPRGASATVTTTPDPRTGRARSLIIELDPEAVAAIVQRNASTAASVAGPFDPGRFHVLPADPITLQSVLHFARTLLVPAVHAAVLRHRLEDLVLALMLQHAGLLARDAAVRSQAPRDLVLATRHLIRAEPESEWPADLIARKLGVSVATLRRRLAEAGASIREIRTDERMALASALLARPGAQVTEIALRCGYRSPSKFARQYRLWSGHAPSERPAPAAYG